METLEDLVEALVVAVPYFVVVVVFVNLVEGAIIRVKIPEEESPVGVLVDVLGELALVVEVPGQEGEPLVGVFVVLVVLEVVPKLVE